MRSLVVSLAIAIAGMLVSIRTASAQDAYWATAHFECLSGNTVVKAKKKVKLDAELGCIVVVDSGAVDGGWARFWVVQDGLSEVPHDRAGALVNEEGMAYFQPESMFNRMDDYLPCKSFEIHAAIFTGDSDMTYTAWEGAITVKGTCKKPKKIKASLACTALLEDGTMFKWPGNGAKVKPRLEAPLLCSVTGKKKGTTPLGMFTVTTPKQTLTAPMSSLQDLKPYAEVGLTPDQDFDTCLSFAVKATVTNDVGQVVWTGKLKIAQDCPD